MSAVKPHEVIHMHKTILKFLKGTETCDVKNQFSVVAKISPVFQNTKGVTITYETSTLSLYVGFGVNITIKRSFG